MWKSIKDSIYELQGIHGHPSPRTLSCGAFALANACIMSLRCINTISSLQDPLERPRALCSNAGGRRKEEARLQC